MIAHQSPILAWFFLAILVLFTSIICPLKIHLIYTQFSNGSTPFYFLQSILKSGAFFNTHNVVRMHFLRSGLSCVSVSHRMMVAVCVGQGRLLGRLAAVLWVCAPAHVPDLQRCLVGFSNYIISLKVIFWNWFYQVLLLNLLLIFQDCQLTKSEA